ncbi:uncharacterized protein [Zea mays]|uniref:uncharacterized protein n=1 Tax=Zea mays TaxID=4577 RepID=UPI0004DE863C|nr:uncharacterized protein LOC103631178 [Zea mays]|eukprot:XP_008650374.1 uncharacterized protein LOC103631178 [Zea mays]
MAQHDSAADSFSLSLPPRAPGLCSARHRKPRLPPWLALGPARPFPLRASSVFSLRTAELWLSLLPSAAVPSSSLCRGLPLPSRFLCARSSLLASRIPCHGRCASRGPCPASSALGLQSNIARSSSVAHGARLFLGQVRRRSSRALLADGARRPAFLRAGLNSSRRALLLPISCSPSLLLSSLRRSLSASLPRACRDAFLLLPWLLAQPSSMAVASLLSSLPASSPNSDSPLPWRVQSTAPPPCRVPARTTLLLRASDPSSSVARVSVLLRRRSLHRTWKSLVRDSL